MYGIVASVLDSAMSNSGLRPESQAPPVVAKKGIAMKASKTRRMILEAITAKDLMWPDPVSIEESATIREGVAFLVDKGLSRPR